jgi:DNA topoisomerase-1
MDASGELRRVTSDDVNTYIRAATGGDFTAKDFRTWTATVLATAALLGDEVEAESEAARKRVVGNAVKTVAARLGNTPAVCRSSYIHPEILSSYMDGQLHRLSAVLDDADEDNLVGIVAIERPVLRFLRRRMTESKKADARVSERSLEQSLAASVAADDARPS